MKDEKEALEQAKAQAENEMAFLHLAALIFDLAANRNGKDSGSILLLLQARRVAQLQNEAERRLKDQDARLLSAQKKELTKLEKSWDETAASSIYQFESKIASHSLKLP